MAANRRFRRKGNVIVMAAFLMVAMLGFLAFAVDMGSLCVARSELQRSADSAAIAAAWELIDENAPTGIINTEATTYAARTRAGEFAALNAVFQSSPALADDDVEVGYLADPTDPNSPFSTVGVGSPNAVRVRVQRTANVNGELPLYFARVLGFNHASASADATAALVMNFGGFRMPSDGGNLGILPYALDSETWEALMAGNATDCYAYDPDTNTVSPGSDGIKEVNMYPQGTGSPGNRGTVDIGGSNNSTADIARQIVEGVNADDLSHHGGSLEFNADGTMELNGDTGISAGVKDELTSIKGVPKIIPIFSHVQGPGNNAQYTITKFVGVRVMDVKLTGSMSGKKVIVQPANVVARGGIPATSGDNSHFIYSPAWLAR